MKLAQIGVNRGFNSAIHSVNLDEDRAFAVKITSIFIRGNIIITR